MRRNSSDSFHSECAAGEMSAGSKVEKVLRSIKSIARKMSPRRKNKFLTDSFGRPCGLLSFFFQLTHFVLMMSRIPVWNLSKVLLLLLCFAFYGSGIQEKGGQLQM